MNALTAESVWTTVAAGVGELPCRGPAADEPVSVVVACFNHGRFLREAVESILAQDHESIEVIVVDDGSTDETRAVCMDFPQVLYHWQANAGLSAARNAGLRLCRGEAVVFLDADDLLLSGALSAGLRCLRANPVCAMAFGGHRGVDVERRPLWEHRTEDGETTYGTFLRSNVVGMHAAVIYRVDALRGIGGFDEGLRACEDYDVYLRISSRHPVASHAAVVAEYRRHEANMSLDPGRMLTSALKVLGGQECMAWSDPGWHRDWKEGLAHYRAYYGRPLFASALRAMAGRGDRQRGASELAVGLRHAPAALPGVALRAAKRVVRIAAGTVPPPLRRALRPGSGGDTPPPGSVDFGDLRRTKPIDPDFGFARGNPVDRHYIEVFLARHAGDIRGRVLEIGDDTYTRQFGAERVTRADVFHASGDCPHATFSGDLAEAPQLPSDSFDCVILTQTLQLIFDVRAAVATLHRVLKPGGVVLATVPGISQIDRGEWRQTWYWSFTEASARRVFGEAFGPAIQVETRGNVLAATAFLHGLAAHELTQEERDAKDPAYQLVIAVRALKSAGSC